MPNIFLSNHKQVVWHSVWCR